MKLNLNSIHLKNLRKQIIKKSSVSSARVTKRGLHIRGKRLEGRIEKAYAHALKDLTSTLRTKTRLPGTPNSPGTKSISVRPYGHTRRMNTLTPHYQKLSNRTLALHKKYGRGQKVYWYESGWYARKMTNRLTYSSKDWRMKNVQFTGTLGEGRKMRMRARIHAPSLYSNTLNKIILEPFFNPHGHHLDIPKSGLDAGNNVVGRTEYLENHRPLLSVIMRRHGKEAWKYLKAEVL